MESCEFRIPLVRRSGMPKVSPTPLETSMSIPAGRAEQRSVKSAFGTAAEHRDDLPPSASSSAARRLAAGQRESRSARSCLPSSCPLAAPAEVLAFAKTLRAARLGAGAQPQGVPSAPSKAMPLAAGAAVGQMRTAWPICARHPMKSSRNIGRIRAARDASGRKDADRRWCRHRVRLHDQGRSEGLRSLRLMQALLDAGADRVSLATPWVMPTRIVSVLFEQALKIAGDRFECGPLHDTRGLALANVCAALQLGVSRFDASLAGTAAARTRRARAATHRPRTWRSCWVRWVSIPASNPCPADAARQGRRLLGASRPAAPCGAPGLPRRSRPPTRQ